MPATATTAAPEPPGSIAPVVSVVPEEGAGSPIELRPVSVSDDRRIVDDLDREVILRGANVNSLGEYWQGDPDHPPTIPVSEDGWDEMAA